MPGAVFTAARAITADGRVVGFFVDTGSRVHGFLHTDGSFTTLDVPVPGAQGTIVAGMNSVGDIVGAFLDSSGVQHGFLWPAYGSFTVVDPPGASLTLARGINAAGDVVGFYDTPARDRRRGFLLSRSGGYTDVDLPNAAGPPVNGTWATSINERGDIVGPFFDGSAVHGYFMSGDTVTQLDVPFAGATQTQAWGMNSQGEIVGYYVVGGRAIAFRRDRHGNYESLDAPTSPASDTRAFGISAAGDIVGQYTHAGVTRGFVMYRPGTP
jgi:probable HAF family extracellular repeat protein